MHTLADPLARALQTAAQRPAITCDGKTITFEELGARFDKLGGMLGSLGLAAGDRVAILSANSAQYIEVYIGVPATGYVIVPLNTRHAEPELRYALEDSGARVLLCDRDPGKLADCVEHVIRIPSDYEPLLAGANAAPLENNIDEETLAGLFYTGGTTGASKGVMLTHRNLIANSFHWMIIGQTRPSDTFLIMAPLFHAAGSNSVAASIWHGSHQIVLPQFEPEAALDLIEAYKVTATLGVPAMIAAMADAQHANPRDVSTLRLIAHGGSPIATEVIRRAREAFSNADFSHIYGATETAPLVTGLLHEQDLLDGELARSCGQPLVGVDCRIIDPDKDHAFLPSGEVGEVVVRGPNVMRGYWNKEEQTREALKNGWYHTGDLGFMTQDGYLILVDRAKDVIVSGGENVYCSEVEEALYQHPAVLEATVFGIPDDKWGEAVHAVVVPRGDLTEEELIAFCREHIAGYKLPKSVSFQTEPLPKSGPGKILKRELRAPFWAGRDRNVN